MCVCVRVHKRGNFFLSGDPRGQELRLTHYITYSQPGKHMFTKRLAYKWMNEWAGKLASLRQPTKMRYSSTVTRWHRGPPSLCHTGDTLPGVRTASGLGKSNHLEELAKYTSTPSHLPGAIFGVEYKIFFKKTPWDWRDNL